MAIHRNPVRISAEQEEYLLMQQEYIAAAERLPWSTRIWVADVVGYFTEEDKNLASQWFSCAVGEFTGHRIESPDSDTEEDEAGMAFYHAVSADDTEGAIEAYYLIQELYQ